MIERELAKVMLNSEQKVIIIEDFNAHYNWWNAKISNSIRMKALIKWVNLYKCNLINTSCYKCIKTDKTDKIEQDWSFNQFAVHASEYSA